ncbi:MAG TPA: hypothetical protein H9906_00455 [Candidatus Paenalcaligenes intestinipullorum]|uniref:Uncharacterized protein n=1 Tax=Candidatus Paenalcaligenes intestinipullorum TaxID=2838718 RepID=A0A9D2RGE4_9BURK|nr:hypothetical protein [Candidatus Paenalcaligenes intestinipullorum]
MKHTARNDAARVELLRMRAALERAELSQHTRGLCRSVHPLSLVGSASGAMSSSKLMRWLNLALSASNRYPLLFSLVSAGLGSSSKRTVKFGLLGMAAWRLVSLFIKRPTEPRAIDEIVRRQPLP